MLKLSISLIFFNLYFIKSARILAVFPTPSYSHQIVFRPLVQELVSQGHMVTVITTDPAYPRGSAPTNLTEIDVHDVSYEMWRKTFVTTASENYNSMIHQVGVAFDMLIKVFEIQVQTKEVAEIIHKKKGDFDLLILEACVKQTLAFSHIFKVPVIQISSFSGMTFHYNSVGSPTHPFLYPSFFHDKLYKLTKWDKLEQFYSRHYLMEKLMKEVEKKENVSLKKLFGNNIPPLSELANNIDLLFLNVYPMWIDNQPVPTNVVFIGGIHKQPQEEINKDLLSYLDSSTNGVIYISFGTNVKPSLLPPEKIATLINVFSHLPIKVLWKWDKDILPGQTNNIKIVKWVPQKDVLKHRNIKLFITQCGLQSTEEAINSGVPLIGIPILVDQFYNAEKYVFHNIGIKLDLELLTEEIFSEAIENVLKNNSYRENVIRLRNLMQDQPESALERAIWWIDYTLRHGGAKHLRARGANILWSEYLELELVFTVLSILLLLSVLIMYVAYYVWKSLSKNLVSFKIKQS